MRSWIAACCAAAALGVCAPQAAARPLNLGFTDGGAYGGDAATRAAWLDRTTQVGGDTVGLGAAWDGISPSRPANPNDPADPAYNFASLDAAVRDATARGFRVVVQMIRAPAWAEGPGRESYAPEGTWKPDPNALADFATAVARRYSGSFDPDGIGPAPPLPAVPLYQVWGEPNLFTNLNPQWVEKKNRRETPFAPKHYRKMLNAAYDALKAVDRSNFVVTGGLGPYGDPIKGGRRMQPALFWRYAFCLNEKLKRTCKQKTKLDALAHDPYSVGGPFRKARNEDDVSVPDMGKLGRILRKAQKRKTVVPKKGQALWVTEISWDSSPPDPDGVPEARQADYLADAFYLFWKAGVEEVLWFQIRDAAPEPSFGATYQSGVFFRDGTPKLAAQAFAFPFTVQKGKGGRLEVWGRAPSGGEVAIERAGATVATLKTGASNVFHGKIKAPGGGDFRASIAGATSLSRSPG